jgi:hypothetical protein
MVAETDAIHADLGALAVIAAEEILAEARYDQTSAAINATLQQLHFALTRLRTTDPHRDRAAAAARLGDVNDTIARLIRLSGRRLTDLTDFADRRGRDLDAVIARINDRAAGPPAAGDLEA